MDKRLTDHRALGTLIEKPESFIIKDQQGDEVTLKLYPLQLGRLMLISDRLLDLDMIFDGSDDDVQQMWKICRDRTRDVAEIVAIATLRTKEDIENELEKRIELLMWSPTMTVDAYTHLLQYIVFQSYFGDFTQAIRSVRMLRVNIANETKAERIAPTEDKPSGAR